VTVKVGVTVGPGVKVRVGVDVKVRLGKGVSVQVGVFDGRGVNVTVEVCVTG